MQQNEYYSRHILEEPTVIRDLDPSFKKVTNRLTDFILNADIAIETGSGETTTKQARASLMREVTDLVALKTAGVDPQSEQAYRIRSLTKDILEALLNGTMIRSLHKSEYLGIISLSLELAKEPQLVNQLTISTGFGGTDQSDINLRLPAYILPGLKMVENLVSTFQKNGLPDLAPTFRVFFAPYAAIRVNGAEMKSDIILKNLATSYQYLKKYIHRFHPQSESHVNFEYEIPWTQHDALTTLTLRYFSSLLQNTQDNAVSDSLKVLRERGHNHGGQDGSNLSSLYAAAHSLLFRDGLNHPGNMFADRTKPLFAISVGGRPERLFNTIRTHIRKNSRIEDFVQQADGSVSELNKWKDDVMTTRSAHNNAVHDTTFHPADLPLISIPSITTVGSHPVYYQSPYDIGLNQAQSSPTAMLEDYRLLIQDDKTLTPQGRALELDKLKGVAHDIKALISDAGGETQLLDLVDSL